MEANFFSRIIRKPPFIFPWVALFHILMLLYAIWSNIFSPFPSVDWIQPLWLLGFTLTWLFACDLRKWAAFGYVGLAILNALLRFVFTSPSDRAIYTFSFFEVTFLFCFFILFYFRRFGR